MTKSVQITQIGRIGNAYGGLHVKVDAGRFMWAIEDYDGFPFDEQWEEIPESLYRELMAFNCKQSAKSET